MEAVDPSKHTVTETICGTTVNVVAVDESDRSLALQVVADCFYAAFASINPDGTPYCIFVSPVVVDGSIYFHGTKAGQKVTNILRDQHVCLTASGKSELRPEDYTLDFASTVVNGTATVVEDEKEQVRVLHEICQKYAPSNMEMFAEAIANSLADTGIYRIEVGSVTYKTHRAPSHGAA